MLNVCMCVNIVQACTESKSTSHAINSHNRIPVEVLNIDLVKDLQSSK